jgi:proline iminopeptidase
MKNPEAHGNRSGVVDTGGARLRYIREGVGPPVVVIGSTSLYPRWFSQQLRQRFELIFVDSRHFVPTYRPSEQELERLTLETFADDVEAMRAHLGVEKWTVLGHSAHGQIALAHASKYPERTSRLVLVGAVPFAEVFDIQEEFWNERAPQERKEQHAANKKAIAEALEAAPESRQFAVTYIGDAARYWADAQYDATPLWEGVETSAAFGRLFNAIMPRAEVRSILETLSTPTLLMLGRLDYAIPHVAWEEIIGGLPQLTYVLLENVSHNPQTESPERFGHELTSWLENEDVP